MVGQSLSMKSGSRKITCIFQDEYPWDVRLDKMVRSLARAGYTCQIVSRNRSGLRRRENYLDGVSIYRLPRWGFSPLLRNFLNIPAFFSPVWIGTILIAARAQGAGLMLVRDLPLVPAALLVGHYLGIPVIMDMAENYPAMIADTWLYRGPALQDYCIRNPALLRIMEKAVVPRCSHVLVVSHASRERVMALGVDPNRITVVGNTPELDYSENIVISPLMSALKRDSSLLIGYVGGLEETRGLDIAIRGMVHIVKLKPDAKLVIVGEGTSRPFLDKLSRHLGLEKNIIFTGWVEPAEISGIVANIDIGIVPHYVTEHTTTTLPNKIFDYMLMKKPVVTTNAASLIELVETTGAGLIYKDQEPHDFANRIVSLFDPYRRAYMGAAGYSAVLSKFNWKYDAANLVSAVRKVL